MLISSFRAMDPLVQYLEHCRSLIQSKCHCQKNNHIRIVLGNESCDLDSMVSTVALGYFYYKNGSHASLPVLNIKQQEFPLRTENCYLLKKLGIESNHLIFRDSFNIAETVANTHVKVTLVDHHVLRPEDTFLASCVTDIFDHRPRDSDFNWDITKVKIAIHEVGSCATLIAEQLLKENLLTNLLAFLLYSVIIFDTIALNPEAGRVRDRDVAACKELREKFSLSGDIDGVFKELWDAHNDVSSLSAGQMLLKDLKVVEGVPVPGLPMLNAEFFRLPDAAGALVSFCQERKASTAVVIGLHVVEGDVHRDIAIYCRSEKELAELITNNLIKAPEVKGYDFSLEEVDVSVEDVRCFKQNNIKLTRKHILPIIKDTIVQYRSTK